MSYFGSLAQGSRSYEQLKVMDDIIDTGSHEKRPVDSINNSGVWII